MSFTIVFHLKLYPVEFRAVRVIISFAPMPPKLMVGGVVSAIRVTVKLAVPTFPAASDAVQVTVVVPTEKLEPEDGEQVGPEVTPTSSDAVTVNVIVLPAELEVEPVRLDGTFTVGGVVSASRNAKEIVKFCSTHML